MWRYTTTLNADKDVQAIYDYIARDSFQYAEKFIHELAETFRNLAALPRIGKPVNKKSNTYVFPHGDYLIFYFIHETENLIAIDRIIHTAQKVKS